jgi:putative addiction module CopG family antidote
MTVNLPADIESAIREKIESGRFSDEADVIRAALELLDRQERLEWLRQTLAEGEVGEPIEFTEALMDRLEAEAEVNAALGKPVSDAVKP